MKSISKKFYCINLLLAAFLISCGSNEDNKSGEDNSSRTGSVEVDINDFGMFGKEFIGSATLTNKDIVFEESKVELSNIVFSMITEPILLDKFDSPKLEYKDQPAKLSVHISGEVKDYSPGSFVVSLTGVSPRMLDSDHQALGTADSEELIKGLSENGVTFPKGINTSNQMEVKFNISASDEDYSSIYLSSDDDFFKYFEGKKIKL